MITFGSVEGYIESMHRKLGQPLTCSVNDPVHRGAIVCSFASVEVEEKAFSAFKDQKRLLISGLIHCAKEGYPVRIDADDLRQFPDEKDLPTLEEIHSFFTK